jgi:hypothetical protein
MNLLLQDSGDRTFLYQMNESEGGDLLMKKNGKGPGIELVGLTPYDAFARDFVQFLMRNQSQTQPPFVVVIPVPDSFWGNIISAVLSKGPAKDLDSALSDIPQEQAQAQMKSAIAISIYTPYGYIDRLRSFITGPPFPGDAGDRFADYNAQILLHMPEPDLGKSYSLEIVANIGWYHAIASACCTLVRLVSHRTQEEPNWMGTGITVAIDDDTKRKFSQFADETTPEEIQVKYGWSAGRKNQAAQ